MLGRSQLGKDVRCKQESQIRRLEQGERNLEVGGIRILVLSLILSGHWPDISIWHSGNSATLDVPMY